MRKNKTIAYMLAATLLVGGTFVGTKAWFSDEVKTDNGIKITMGTLDLKLKENGSQTEGTNTGWKLVRDETKITDESNTKKESREDSKNEDIKTGHTNIRPGDYFERTFTVTNTGSLDQIVSIESVFDKDFKNNYFTLTIDDTEDDLLTNSNEFRLNQGQSKTVTLKLETKVEALNNNQQGEAFDFTGSFGNITLTGRQINESSTPLSE